MFVTVGAGAVLSRRRSRAPALVSMHVATAAPVHNGALMTSDLRFYPHVSSLEHAIVVEPQRAWLRTDLRARDHRA